jgi:hypothetical protein
MIRLRGVRVRMGGGKEGVGVGQVRGSGWMGL